MRNRLGLRRASAAGSILSVAALASAALPALGGVTFTNQGTGALANWAAVPGKSIVYASLATPATANTSQGNVANATGAAFTAMAETFTPATNYTLGAIGISGSGGQNATNIQMHLYDVTPPRATSNNGSVQTGSGAQYSVAAAPPLVDLLGGGAGLS